MDFLARLGWQRDALRATLRGDNSAWNVDAFLETAVAEGRIRPGVFTERDRKLLTEAATTISSWVEGLNNAGWGAEQDPPSKRRLWAGRPWASEPGRVLRQPGKLLLPIIQAGKELSLRDKLETAVQVLLDPAPSATLATFHLGSEPRDWVWQHGATMTEALAKAAQEYWNEATLRPLPFYPDFVEQLAKQRKDRPDDPWTVAVERAWWDAQGAYQPSHGSLARCAYAALVFPEEPDWLSVARDAELWWEALFVPLAEAWK